MWRWLRPTHRTPHWVRPTHPTPHWGVCGLARPDVGQPRPRAGPAAARRRDPAGSGVDVPGDRAHDLGDLLGVLAVRVTVAPQVRLHLQLEQLDHVLDQAVQLLGRATARLDDGRWRVEQPD